MQHAELIGQLAQNRDVFSALFTGVTAHQVSWKPAADKWSLLEVLCHLYDEEREDFRARLKHTLETPNEPLPKIDPQGWVKERGYASRDFGKTLYLFLHERDESVKWLKGLENPSWANAYQHPKFGPMSAEMFLANWLAHDYLHFRQITRLKYDYLRAHTTVRYDYAGDW
ncbi:MAG: DinB family protein [Bacteroidota bacterium]